MNKPISILLATVLTMAPGVLPLPVPARASETPPKTAPKPAYPESALAPVHPGPVFLFSCERSYMLSDKKQPCDSNVKADGERLRPLLKDLPTALNELDLYQKGTFESRNAAYAATLGLGVVIAGIIASRAFMKANSHEGNTTRALSAYGGIWLSLNMFFYGLSLTRSNEMHLMRAVDEYNVNHPDRPIMLQFSVGIPIEP